jgi:ketosteroid isomerase-like protein
VPECEDRPAVPDIDNPDHLGAALLAAINAGDLDGVMSCYEPCAVLELPDGTAAVGHASIRQFYADLLETRPVFAAGQPAPSLVVGDIALTTTVIGPTATAEVARRQPDGTWRWVLDRPDVMLRGDEA